MVPCLCMDIKPGEAHPNQIRGPSYVDWGFLFDAPVLPPHGLISPEGGNTAATQPGIFDRPTFLFHSRSAEVAISTEQVIVLLALPHVLCWGFVPVCIARVRSRLCRNSR